MVTGGRRRIRTSDRLVKSQLLYQLSYAPTKKQRKYAVFVDLRQDFRYSSCVSYAAVAQLDRARGFGPRGRGFDSFRPHQTGKVKEFWFASLGD